ncbi:hypothetical protein EH243_14600 [Amphritea opalescens]|uniref:Uncharacterized protein n=1 Tax=Amphritea opalescens TaxID=2490544 RepID=A0A430KN38_9GAMM|nr:hypothetical protein [Amphritea opalescens]RTE64907.1 hypothetical protein EH243_14600 [Amphritea opalescens]
MNIWQRNYCTNIVASMTWLAVVAIPVAQADTVQPKSFGLQGAAVSDSELASMRGRFIDGRNVTFFGVSMMTDWYLQSGKHIDMEMQVNFDLSGDRYQPTMSMYRSQDVGSQVASGYSGDEPLDNISNSQGLNSVSGVVQNIQVAGDQNRVENGVEWTISDQAAVQQTDGLVKVDVAESQNHLTEEGVGTKVSVGTDGVGYQVDVPDVGRVTQHINSSQLTGGNILQSTQLNSDLNQVFNRIGLTVTLSPETSNMHPQNINNALNQLRGLQ